MKDFVNPADSNYLDLHFLPKEFNEGWDGWWVIERNAKGHQVGDADLVGMRKDIALKAVRKLRGDRPISIRVTNKKGAVSFIGPSKQPKKTDKIDVEAVVKNVVPDDMMFHVSMKPAEIHGFGVTEVIEDSMPSAEVKEFLRTHLEDSRNVNLGTEAFPSEEVYGEGLNNPIRGPWIYGMPIDIIYFTPQEEYDKTGVGEEYAIGYEAWGMEDGEFREWAKNIYTRFAKGEDIDGVTWKDIPVTDPTVLETPPIPPPKKSSGTSEKNKPAAAHQSEKQVPRDDVKTPEDMAYRLSLDSLQSATETPPFGSEKLTQYERGNRRVDYDGVKLDGAELFPSSIKSETPDALLVMPGIKDLKSSKRLIKALEGKSKEKITQALENARREAEKKGGILMEVKYPLNSIDEQVRASLTEDRGLKWADDGTEKMIPYLDGVGIHGMTIYDYMPLYGPKKEGRRKYIDDMPEDEQLAIWSLLRYKEDSKKVSTKEYDARGKKNEMEVHTWEWDTFPDEAMMTILKPLQRYHKSAVRSMQVWQEVNNKRKKKWPYRVDALNLLMFGLETETPEYGSEGHLLSHRAWASSGHPNNPQIKMIRKTHLVAKAPNSPWSGMLVMQESAGEQDRRPRVRVLMPEARKGQEPLGWVSPADSIEVRQDGKLIPEVAIARFADVLDVGMPKTLQELRTKREYESDAGRARVHPRNVAIDIEKQANLHTTPVSDVAGKKKLFGHSIHHPDNAVDKVLSYAWWLMPNQVDLTGLDDLRGDSPLVFLHTGKDKSGEGTYMIGSPENKKIAQKIIKENFTARERGLLGDVIINLEGELAGTGAAGTHSLGHYNVPGRNISLIEINPNYLKLNARDEMFNHGKLAGNKIDDSTLTHEVIHHLRAVDPARKGSSVSRESLTESHGRFLGHEDRDLEEAMTDAETMARAHMNPINQTAGYHQFVKGDQALESVFASDIGTQKYNAIFSELNEKERKSLEKRLMKLPEEKRDEMLKILRREGNAPVKRGSRSHGSKPYRMGISLPTGEQTLYDRMLMRNLVMPPGKKAYVEGKRNEFTRKSLGELGSVVPVISARDAQSVLWTDVNEHVPTTLKRRVPEHLRKTIKERMLKPVKGKVATDRLRKIFPHLNLARLKHSGKAEAIDTYWVTETQIPGGEIHKTITHVYSPKPEEVTREEMIDLVVPDTVSAGTKIKVSEYQDGELEGVRIPKSAKPKFPAPRKSAKPKATRKTFTASAPRSRRQGKVRSYKDTSTGRTYFRRGKGSMPNSRRFAPSK